ncbi:hypothetical protein SSX86_028241 [Deinandra increscens subsp. villosa]|uniref:Sm domain-containing protein n=1 Tax=Deinandra increscens subsp. villosa TaxID=3103831 RepID=A0AAP0GKM1_9ASTR
MDNYEHMIVHLQLGVIIRRVQCTVGTYVLIGDGESALTRSPASSSVRRKLAGGRKVCVDWKIGGFGIWMARKSELKVENTYTRGTSSGTFGVYITLVEPLISLFYLFSSSVLRTLPPAAGDPTASAPPSPINRKYTCALKLLSLSTLDSAKPKPNVSIRILSYVFCHAYLFQSGRKETVLDLAKFVDKGVQVKLTGGRQVEGTLKGYDQLLNLVLDDATEFLRDTEDPLKTTDQNRRLGLIVCRGTAVMLVSPTDGTEEIENPFVQPDGA